jgi:peptide deformylase
MPLLSILKYPDPELRKISEPIRSFDQNLADLAADLRETMLAAPGVGLAAPQVGRPVRLIVVDWSDEDEGYGASTLALVNPRTIEADGRLTYNEGCLSVTDLQSKVERAERVKVAAQDLEGQPFVVEAEGRRAVILQHEMDHLDGVLFIDRLSRIKREMYNKKLKKSQTDGEAKS